MVPDLIDFMSYCFYNQNFKVDNLGFKKSKAFFGNIGIKAIDWVRKTANEALAESRHFHPTADIRDLAKMARPIVSEGNQTGEGWFLTGEMMELIHDDVPNIVCIQRSAACRTTSLAKVLSKKSAVSIRRRILQPSTTTRVQAR